MKILASTESCIEALRGALLNRRKAMLAEFAVGLAVFFGERSADMHAKKILRALYASVGYDSLARSGADYEMIGKRVDAMAALYEKIGHKRILLWSDGETEATAIASIAAEIDKLQLYTIKDVSMYCHGEREPAHREPPSHDRRAGDKGFAFTYETPHIRAGILPGVSSVELEKAAKKLLEMAKKLREGEKLAA